MFWALISGVKLFSRPFSNGWFLNNFLILGILFSSSLFSIGREYHLPNIYSRHNLSHTDGETYHPQHFAICYSLRDGRNDFRPLYFTAILLQCIFRSHMINIKWKYEDKDSEMWNQNHLVFFPWIQISHNSISGSPYKWTLNYVSILSLGYFV